MRWVEALKIWNAKKGGAWCVPKKGTAEHAEVMKIIAGEKVKATAPAAPATEMEETVTFTKKQLKEFAARRKARKAEREAKVAALTERSKEKKREAIKKFLREAIEKRKAKKAAKRASEPTNESIKKEYDSLRDSFIKQRRVDYKDLAKLRDIAEKASLPAITKENAIDPFFKELKVGDTLSTSRIGESQESAAVTVYASWKVKSISSGHKTFNLMGGEYGNEVEANGTIQIDRDGSYMSIKRPRSSDRMRANPEEQTFIPTFESAIAKRVANKYAAQEREEFEAKRMMKKAEDWTKKSRMELVDMIDKYFEKKGQTMRGHKTASKPRLIEIIKKYNIAE